MRILDMHTPLIWSSDRSPSASAGPSRDMEERMAAADVCYSVGKQRPSGQKPYGHSDGWPQEWATVCWTTLSDARCWGWPFGRRHGSIKGKPHWLATSNTTLCSKQSSDAYRVPNYNVCGQNSLETGDRAASQLPIISQPGNACEQNLYDSG